MTNASAAPFGGAQQAYVQGTAQRHMQQGPGQGVNQGSMQGYGQAPGALAPSAPASAAAVALAPSHASVSMQQPASQRPHASLHLSGSQGTSQLGASWGGHSGLPAGQQAAQQRALQAKPEPASAAGWRNQPAQLGGGALAAPHGSAVALGHAAWGPGSGAHAGGPEGTQQGRMAGSAGVQTGAQLVPQRQQPQQAGMLQPGSGSWYAASAPPQVVVQASAAAHGHAGAHLPAQPPAWQQEAPARTAARPHAHAQLQAGHALSQQQSALQAQTQAGFSAGSQQGFHAYQVHQSVAVRVPAPARVGQPQNPSFWQQGHGGHNASAGVATSLAAQPPLYGSGSGGGNAAAYGITYGPASGSGSGNGAAAHGSGDVKTGVSGTDGSYSQAAMARGAGHGSAAAAHGVGGGSAAYHGGEAPGACAAAYGRSVAGLHPASSAGTAFNGSAVGASAGDLGSHGRPGGYAVGGPWGPLYGGQASAGTGDAHQAGAPMKSTVYQTQHAQGQFAAGSTHGGHAHQHAVEQRQIAPVAAAAPYTSNPAPHALGGSALGHGQGSYPVPGPAYAQGFLQQRGAGASGAGAGSQGAQTAAAAGAYPGYGPPFGQPAVQAGATATGKPDSDPYQAHAGGGVQWGQAPAQRQWG